MNPTYTNEFRSGFIQDYIYFNLVSFLIYKPSLGLTNSPTASELKLRRDLNMNLAAAAEIGSESLNGYRRQIITLTNSTVNVNETSTTVEGSSEFIAEGGPIGPFTHIVVARGADLRNKSVSNGNNRGNNQGTVIFVEPVISAPIVIESPVSFTHSLKFSVSTAGLLNV